MKKFNIILIMLLIMVGSMAYAETTRYVTKYTRGGYPAALTEDLLDKAVAYAMSDDLDALRRLVDTNKVFILKSGVQVYVIDRSHGRIKVRIPGDIITFWTVREAIHRQNR